MWTAVSDRISTAMRAAYEDQDPYRTGVEVEDLILSPDGAPATMQTATAILDRLSDHSDAEPQYEHAFGEETITGVTFPDQYDDVPIEIDNDFNAMQSEIGTATRTDPAALLDHLDEVTVLRAQAAGDYAFHALALSPGLMAEHPADPYTAARIEAGDLPPVTERIPAEPRYAVHVEQHGHQVHAMGTIASVQISRQFRMDDTADDPVDEMFYQVYNGGELPSVPAILPLVNAPFMASPVFEDGELVAHWGRRDQYKRALDPSPYVNTDGTTKHGYVPELAAVNGVEDYVDAAANKLMQMSPPIAFGDMHLEDGRTVAEAYDLDPTGTAHIGIGVDAETRITFRDFVDAQAYDGFIKLPVDGELQRVEVRVDHTVDAFTDVAQEYFAVHSSFWWPEIRARVAPGVFENRIPGNSPRRNEAILTHIGLSEAYREVQERFYAEGVREKHASTIWEEISTSGMEYELPSGTRLDTFYEEELLPVLADGLYDAFGPGSDTRIRDETVASYLDTMRADLARGTAADDLAAAYRNGMDAVIEETRL